MDQDGTRRAVHTDGAPAPVYSYSQAIVSNGLLFVSGQVPVDPVTKAVPPAFGDQVRQVLDNLAAIAQAAGGRLVDAVKMGVYLSDLEDFEEMDTIYKSYFEAPLPARTTVGVGIRGFTVEMDAIVALRDRG